jgi:3-methylfumaryl-CoA hydratase
MTDKTSGVTMQEDISQWVGRREEVTDVLEAARTNALSTALGDAVRVGKGDPLPLLHHWLYFWDVRPPEGLGPDGHPAKGGFLPPVTLPRRMWAGGRLKFFSPLHVGAEVTRASTIQKIEAKSGKSGSLVFVTVVHELAEAGAAAPAVVEEQDIVYREPAASALTAPEPGTPAPACAWRREIDPTTVLLFRYSALTMNGHRIHYDRPYAMGEEGYPALVVHGPLQATLLAGLAASRMERPMTTFEFRGQSPSFDGAALHVCGEPTDDGARLWTEQAGRQSMVATADWGAIR